MSSKTGGKLKNGSYTKRCVPDGQFRRSACSVGLKRFVLSYKHITLIITSIIQIGSGKKALLDVISRRVQGPTRGQILLNSQPMSLSLFQQRCGYVTHKCDLIPGLTVEQTLFYTPTKVYRQNQTRNVVTGMFSITVDWLFEEVEGKTGDGRPGSVTGGKPVY